MKNMKHLIILGAGGFARDVYNFAINSKGYNELFDVKGFLDINLHSMDGFEGYPPILGSENNYVINENDVFITAIGDNNLRKKIVDVIISKGGKFITLIHKTSILHTNAIIGDGCLIQPNSMIGADTKIGCHSYIQNGVTIGHDAVIGSFCRIDCNVVFIGGTSCEDYVTVHTNSVVNHKVSIGEGAVVGACSFVIRKVKPGTTVVGNPAKKLME